MRIKLLICFLVFGISGFAAKAQQAEGSYLLSASGDLFRTDFPGVITRYQLAGEVNYFYLHNLSFSGGYEYNHNRANQVSLGMRFYPLEAVFVRARGLVGSDSDLAFGAGYTYNLTYRFRLEGMVDYYAISHVAGVRAGIGILIN